MTSCLKTHSDSLFRGFESNTKKSLVITNDEQLRFTATKVQAKLMKSFILI